MKIHLFIPCLVEHLIPEIGVAMKRCLEAMGYSVAYKREQTCCGQAHYNSGYLRDAKGLAKRFVKVFADAEVVVGPSWSCVEMVRERYGKLLENTKMKEEFEYLRPRIFELTEFIMQYTDVWTGTFLGRAVPHWSCHMPSSAEQGVIKLLSGISGLEIIHPPHRECCGFGGTFWVKWREVSAKIGMRRLENLISDRIDTIIMFEPGCLAQIRLTLNEVRRHEAQALHVAEVLSLAISGTSWMKD